MASRRGRSEALTALAVFALRGLLALLPWRARLAVAGGLGRLALARVPRLRRRVEANLAYAMPELGPAERDRLRGETGDHFGRVLAEMLFARGFARRQPWRPPIGAGAAALAAALREGRGAIVISGHFGQWEAGRAWMKTLGRSCAGVYRPLRNRRLEALYLDNIAFTGAPMFPKGRRSVRAIAGHVAKGGVLALLVDQYEQRGPRLDFLGRPAPTTLVAAELALRYGVPLFPGYGIRAPDGVTIEIVIEPPIPPAAPEAMMAAFNASLGARVRAHPGQYWWLHRRWEKTLPPA